ncbi:hypothetical protein QA645_23870 [Bradyrhizobium sp. CIAT3101]|uniref:hypothetical protein n=1 Tax=Bradyrhizobium sp. CIAT3101 TaxID=439387 RepID=UPI0024B1964F|nr:hypothetical protein [Bradyrhizobium sp. CIAT3101]WFU77595.1 hypothetical protein QA645_23870 [Bradyrhizobium sp. CIAT3101]
MNAGTQVARCEEFFCRKILSQRINALHEMERAYGEQSLHRDDMHYSREQKNGRD